MRKMIDSGVEWLGDIPETWDLVQLGSLFSEHKNKNTGMQSNNLLSLSYGNIIRKDINTSDGLLPESFEGYNVIDDGDIVLRLTDLQNDQRSLRVGLSHERGIVTSAYVTLRKRNPAMNSQFFYYLIHSYDVRKGFYGMGAGVRQGLNFAGVRKIMLTLPSVNEQVAIADFLGKKIEQVDALIANVQAQIEKLKGYKQSVITEVVTKGLDPTVPLKDSGVEWIGEMPEHWMPIRLKHLCSKIADGTHFSPPTTDEGYPYITAKDVHGKGIDFSSTARISEDNYLQMVKADCKPEKGDVLIVKDGATTGRVGMVIDDTCFVILSSVAMLRPIESCMSAFLMYVLESELIQKQIKISMAGSAMPRTTLTKLAEYYGVLPTIDEQNQIVQFLDKKCGCIDRLIITKQSKIEKLEQYKRSLIYEYVTGKKEVS